MTEQPDTEQTVDDYDRGFVDGRAASVADFDFTTWLEFGQGKGWISEGVCATHDGIPSTPEESAEFESGGDPCQPALRVWMEKVNEANV